MHLTKDDLKLNERIRNVGHKDPWIIIDPATNVNSKNSLNLNLNRLRNNDGQSPRISKTQIVIPDDHWKHSTEVKCDDHDRPSRIWNH